MQATMQRDVRRSAPHPATGWETGGYLAAVDGLRAVAILSVVAYHFRPDVLSGGFVGVDVFFVISGFLIIGQVVRDLRNGSFAFAEFWSRRALRILPPYLIVIVACLAIAPFVLVVPEEFRAFSREVGWSAVFAINHLFLDQQDYFDAAASTKPLLHLWSLAVEEQFYIAAPLIAYGTWKLPRRAAVAIVGVLFVASLVACIHFTSGDKNYAFYVMPLRAWEFIAGGIVAVMLPYLTRLPRLAFEAIGMIGLIAVAAAAATFSSEHLFPAHRAALPVFGAAAVILAVVAKPSVAVARVLSLPLMVGIGLISYAWYLWHWPLLTFARIHNFGSEGGALDAAMVGLSLVLAVATRFALEKPILMWRRRRGNLSWRPTLVGVMSCLVVAGAGQHGMIRLGERAALAMPERPDAARTGNLGRCDFRLVSDIDACKEDLGATKPDSFLEIPKRPPRSGASTQKPPVMGCGSPASVPVRARRCSMPRRPIRRRACFATARRTGMCSARRSDGRTSSSTTRCSIPTGPCMAPGRTSIFSSGPVLTIPRAIRIGSSRTRSARPSISSRRRASNAF